MGNYIIHTYDSTIYPETHDRLRTKKILASICWGCLHNSNGYCLKAKTWCRIANEICRDNGKGSVCPKKVKVKNISSTTK